MSRSFRKTPKGGIATARSEKKDKRMWHKTFRTKTRQILKSCIRCDRDILLPSIKDVSDPWSFSKDGKRYWGANKKVFLKQSRTGPPKKVAALRRYRFCGMPNICSDHSRIVKAYRK